MIATLDFVQDVLSGLNVRADNYLDPYTEDKLALERYLAQQDHEAECVSVPFIVFVWDDGLDCGHFDDWPGYHPAACHRTLKGAEVEAAHLEHFGIEASRINILPGWIQRWELDYHPIRD